MELFGCMSSSLSQALPRAGDSLVRPSEPFLEPKSRQTFNKLSFPGEEEKRSNVGGPRRFAEPVMFYWPPEPQIH